MLKHPAKKKKIKKELAGWQCAGECERLNTHNTHNGGLQNKYDFFT